MTRATGLRAAAGMSVALLLMAGVPFLARGSGATPYEALLSYAFLALILPWLAVLILVRAGAAAPARARGAALAEGLSLGAIGGALGLPIGLGFLVSRPPDTPVLTFLLLFCAAQAAVLVASRAMRDARRSRTVFVSGATLAAVPFMLLIIGQLVSFGRGNGHPEADAISDLRSVISAEAAYESASGGVYGTLECLARPGPCLPGYPVDGPTFLDPAFLLPERRGYRFEFQGSVQTEGNTASAEAGPGFEHYAVTATPLQPGRTGIRVFCGDSTAVIRFAGAGPLPPLRDGWCPPSMEPLK